MFVHAIDKASKFTRPIHSITRMLGSKTILPGAATLFLVNDEGYALTCKHVAELLVQSDGITKNYAEFVRKRDQLSKDEEYPAKVNALLQAHRLQEHSLIQIKNRFVDCVDTLSGFKATLHPTQDLAIIKFEGFNQLHCTEFPIFKKETTQIMQGEFLCRLGFPFPEFTNFRLNEVADTIEWTTVGMTASPRFPIEGMVTRFLGDAKGNHVGIELSTPGLRGQSGGPLFNKDGVIYGMQSRTKHLHLGFDIENLEINSNGRTKAVNDYSFLHLGECIYVSVIKDFLRENKVKFQEE